MAEIVLGIGTSHSRMLSLPAELWGEYAARDKGNPMLLSLEDGRVMSYEELLETADPAISHQLTPEVFQQQYESCQKAISTLEEGPDRGQPRRGGHRRRRPRRAVLRRQHAPVLHLLG